MNIFFTGSEGIREGVPFLLDARMRPLTVANAWLREIAQDGATSSSHTLRTYAYTLFDFFSYLEANKLNWLEVSNDVILSYRDTQDQNVSPHTKRDLNRRTINARLMTVGRFYAFAFEERHIKYNPVRYKKIKVRPPADTQLLSHLGYQREVEVPVAAYERLPAPKIKWRSHQEVMRWMNSIAIWRDKLISKLLYRTGMRREELVSLKTSDLPKRGSVDTSRLEVEFVITGKGRKSRAIYPATRDFLELHDYIKVERAQAVSRMKAKHDLIFVTRRGQPLRPHCLNLIFKRVSEGCGITITPHMLRHSFAVTALQHWKSIGVSRPEKLLQARLGHASLITTQIYMHLTDEMRAEEACANASLIELFLRGEIDEAE